MAYTWADLDAHLRWDKRKEPDLPPKPVHEGTDGGGHTWRVYAKRGTEGRGNQDLVAPVESPSGRKTQIESLKQLADDIVEKARAHPAWMRRAFMPSLVRVIALGDPISVLQRAPDDLPGYPPGTLLALPRIIGLTESRKYRAHQPLAGRYSIVRVCAGLVWGVWTEEDLDHGTMMQKTVAVLRAKTGVRETSLGWVLSKGEGLDRVTPSPAQLEALSL